jgi:hypothetical protein
MSQTELFVCASKVSTFEDDAMGFLLKFLKRTRGQPFSAEQVTQAALIAGIAPFDLRTWGPVFAQAARDGYIRRSDVLFRRELGNGTLAPGWVAC